MADVYIPRYGKGLKEGLQNYNNPRVRYGSPGFVSGGGGGGGGSTPAPKPATTTAPATQQTKTNAEIAKEIRAQAKAEGVSPEIIATRRNAELARIRRKELSERQSFNQSTYKAPTKEQARENLMRAVIDKESQPVLYEKKVDEFTPQGTDKKVPVTEVRYKEKVYQTTPLGTTKEIIIDRKATEQEINYYFSNQELQASTEKINPKMQKVKESISLNYQQVNYNLKSSITDPLFIKTKKTLGYDITSASDVKKYITSDDFFSGFISEQLKDIREKPAKNIALFGLGAGFGFGVKAVGAVSPVVGEITTALGAGLGTIYVAGTATDIYRAPTYQEKGGIFGVAVKDISLMGYGGKVGSKKGSYFFDKIKVTTPIRNIKMPKAQEISLPISYEGKIYKVGFYEIKGEKAPPRIRKITTQFREDLEMKPIKQWELPAREFNVRTIKPVINQEPFRISEVSQGKKGAIITRVEGSSEFFNPSLDLAKRNKIELYLTEKLASWEAKRPISLIKGYKTKKQPEYLQYFPRSEELTSSIIKTKRTGSITVKTTSPKLPKNIIWHYTKEKNIPKILKEGYKTNKPTSFLTDSDTKLGESSKVLYFTKDSKWSEGGKLKPLYAEIKPGTKILKISSRKKFLEINKASIKGYTKEKAMNERLFYNLDFIIKEAKTRGYDIVNIKYSPGRWYKKTDSKFINKIKSLSEKDSYKGLTTYSGTNDFFIINKKSISLLKEKPILTKKLKSTTVELFPYGKRTDLNQAVTRQKQIVESPNIDVYSSQTVFKDISKVNARASGKTPKLRTTLYNIKETLVLDSEPIKIIKPSSNKKTSLSSTFKEQKALQESKPVNLPKLLPKTTGTTKTVVKTTTTDSQVLAPTYVGGQGKGKSIYYGQGMETNEISYYSPKTTPKLNENIKTEQYTENKVIGLSRGELKTKEIGKVKEVSKIKEITEVKEISKVKEINKVKQISKVKQIGKLKTVQQFKFFNALKPSRYIPRTPYRKPKEYIIVPPGVLGSSSKLSQSGRYTVSVRRFGKFRPVGTFSSLSKAFSTGTSKVRTSLGATFKVSGGKKLSMGTPKGFYSKPTKGGVLFIEQPKFRLSTATEKLEIQSFRRKK